MSNRSKLGTLSILAAVGLAASMFDLRRHMKVNSPIFNEISGKLGGAVGMTSRFGMQLRGKVTGSNPLSPGQYIVRNNLASLASLYRDTLTPTERGTWEGLADDTPGAASGLALFVRGNSELRHSLSGPVEHTTCTDVLTAPDSSSCDFSPPAAAAIVDASAHTLAIDVINAATEPWAGHDNGALCVYVSRPQPASRRTRIHPYVLVAAFQGNHTTPPTIPDTLDLWTTSDLKDHFGGLAAGKIVYVKYTSSDGLGRRSRDYAERVAIVA